MTTDKMRIVRALLLTSLVHSDSGETRIDDKTKALVQNMLNCDFPEFPMSRIVPTPEKVIQFNKPRATDDKPDAYLNIENGGYVVYVRRHFPFRYYSCMISNDHAQASLFVWQLCNDPSLRLQEVRDAKSYEQLTPKKKEKVLQKRREKWSFDMTGLDARVETGHNS